MAFSSNQWAVILGGSSGFGLATAQRLAEQGMSLCIVHRDRRAMLKEIEPFFEKLRAGRPLMNETLFATIDAMPMRQREMRRN